MYAIQDRIAAFCFDRAVTLWGRALESELQTKTKDAKNDSQADMKSQAVYNRWLYIDGEQSKGRFADPMARVKRT